MIPTQKNKGSNNKQAGRDINETTNIIIEKGNNIPLNSNIPKEPLYTVEFVGREKEIQEIREVILSGKGGYKLSIEGVGGLGKSTLAYKICQQFIEDGTSIANFWFTAKNEEFTTTIEKYKGNFHNTKSFLTEAVTLMGYNPNEVEDLSNGNLKNIFKQLLSKHSSKGKIIFVLDNLETVRDESFFELIKEMRLFPGDFYLIITSRNSLSLNNENNLILEPFSESDIEKIIGNFVKFFGLGKLKIELKTLIKYCSGNPLIARIIIQKMLYSSSSQIYNDYLKDSPNKQNEILEYIYKNTFDVLNEESKYMLLVFAYFESIDEYILIEVERVLQEKFGESFSITDRIEQELSKTFFIVIHPSNTSRFGIKEIRLSDFTKVFLLDTQDSDSLNIYSKVNIGIQKRDQRYLRYQQTTEALGANNKIESSIISDILDLEKEFKNRNLIYTEFLKILKDLEKDNIEIPYIKLVISKTIRNHSNHEVGGLNEAVLYGERALSLARERLKEMKFLKYYIYNLIGLYESLKIYDKKYKLAKELLEKGELELETHIHIIRHELNVGQVEKAFYSASRGYKIVNENFDSYFKKSKFEVENLLRMYYQAAVALGEFDVIKELYEILKKYKIEYLQNSQFFDFEEDYKKMNDHVIQGGIERLKSMQLLKMNKNRYKKEFITKIHFINFLEERLKIDENNSFLMYELYKLTNDINKLYSALDISPNTATYLTSICIELSKFGGDRILEINNYAEKGMELYPDNICFYGFMGLYYSKKNDIKKSIAHYQEGISKYESFDENKQNNTFNNKHYLIMKTNLEKIQIQN